MQQRDYRAYFAHYFPKLRPSSNGDCLVRSPFREDRNPSLSLNLNRGLWFDFGTQEGGGVADFERRKNGGSATEAWMRACRIIGCSPNGGPPEQLSTYSYTNESGDLLYQVVRFPQKQFRQRRPDGQSGWVWNLGAVRRVLYRLPEVIASERVFVVEGEKDCEMLRSLGLVATTNSGGAGKWRLEFSERFTEKEVVIFPDNDEAGRKHAEQVASSLSKFARWVKVVPLPMLAEHGDVSDFCEKVGDRAKTLLLAAVEDVPQWNPSLSTADSASANVTPGESLTDLGNSRRLVNMHGSDIRYCPAWGQWLIWDGTRWKPDQTAEIMRRAKEALIGIQKEAASATDKKERDELQRWAKQSQSEGKIRSAISLSESEADVVVTPDALDSDPWLFNCRNGMLDLRTLELSPHERANLLTKRAEVSYDPNARCPTFELFLDKITNGDSDLKVYLQSVTGYSLTGLTREQCVFMLYGTGANGKSTFLEVLRAMLGDYARNADFSTFAVRDRTGASSDLARLAGARLVTAVETEPGERLSQSRIKSVTGGDRITARQLYCSEFEFSPQFKVWLGVNHKPAIRSGEHAIWRRIKLIPFTVTIADAEQDRDLLAKLVAEISGILTWAVRGCAEWQKPGLKTPPKVLEAIQEYREESDALADWLQERCELDRDAETPSRELFDDYCGFSRQSNERAMARNSFGTALTERGFSPARYGKGRTRLRTGIRLRRVGPEQSKPVV